MKHIKLKDLLFENTSKKIKEVEAFVTKNSYFDVHDMDSDFILFSTREHGDVGSETASDKDFRAAHKLKREIERNFKTAIVEVEVVDEWVNVSVKFPKKEIDFEETRLNKSEYLKIAEKINNFIVGHVINNYPDLSPTTKHANKADRVPLKKREYAWVMNTGRPNPEMEQSGRAVYYEHKIEVNWIDTDIPVSVRKKNREKYRKQLERDLYKKFNLGRFINDKKNDKFDVTIVGGDGIWANIIVTSPYLTY